MKIQVCRIDGMWTATLVGTTISAQNISRDEAITMLRDSIFQAVSVACTIARNSSEKIK